MKKTYDKRIITHQWGNNPTNDEYTSTNGFVISDGYYTRTVAYVKELTDEAKKDFPHLTDDDIEVFIITESLYNKGFMGVRFPLPENQEHEDYHLDSRLNFSTT